MPFPLQGQSLVLTGRFADVDTEDAKWALIARGARVHSTVARTTSALLAGDGAEAKLLAAAARHKVPVLGASALRALMQGETLARARSVSEVPQPAARPLAGRSVVVFGAPRSGTQEALAARLRQLGASVTRKASARTTLMVSCAHTADGIDAIQAGIDLLLEDDVASLEAGAALWTFLGRRDVEAPEPAVFAATKLQALHDELRAIDTGGERWDDELTLTLHPSGRVAVALRALDGTPVEDHVRRVLQREDWPRVREVVTVKHAIEFG